MAPDARAMTTNDDAVERFAALWNRCVGGAGSGPEMYAELERLYSGPDRRFHHLGHIRGCLALLDEVAPLLDDRDSVEMALWFHDAIYVPGARDNERRSAQLFADRTSGVASLFRRKVCALIIATRHTGHAQGKDRRFVVDIDLAGFAAPWEEFVRQGTALRAEFAAQDDRQYYAGQIAFLRRLQQRRHFFATGYFRERGELRAQDNLGRLLALRIGQGYGN